MITNCPNCGAVLKGTICEYCGTDLTNGFEANFSKYRGTITIDGKEYNVYMSDSIVSHINEPYRDMNGALHRGEPVIKHKFTLIEY